MGKDAAGKIRIDLQLQDARTGETIAVVSREGTESNLADLVSEGGADLRQKLGIGNVAAGDSAQVRAAVPANLEAARLYAEGLVDLQKYDAFAARDVLQKAIAADPNHALSHWALAQSWFGLGYDAKAQEEAKKAFDLSGQLSRENRLAIEARYREFSHDYPAAIEIYRTLYNFFPDHLGYGLSLAGAQLEGGANKECLATIRRIRASSPSFATDPRVDLAESNIRQSLSDYKQEQQIAATAGANARAQGAMLMVASARLEEAWAWEHLGKIEESMAAVSDVRELARGKNPRLEAQATLYSGHLLYDTGKFEDARKFYDQALVEYQKIGDQQGVARSNEAIANVLVEQDKLEEAKRYYEEEIRINREIGREQGLSAGLLGLGNLLEVMGDFAGAAQADQQGLQGFQKLGNKRAIATAMSNWGNVLIEQGNLTEAKSKIEEAATIQREIGYKRGLAFSLSSVAEILRLQDHLEESSKISEQAGALRKEIGDEGNGPRSDLQLAQITLERGHPADAESQARTALASSNKAAKSDLVSQSYAVLAKALLQQGKIKDAQEAAQHAVALAQKLDRSSRFEAAIAAARAEMGAGKFAEAKNKLAPVLAQATENGYFIYIFDARLALAEVALKSGQTGAARAQLTALEKTPAPKGSC